MRQGLDHLRDAALVEQTELDSFWAGLDTLRPDEILGSWRGGDFAHGHPLSGLLSTLRWHAKRFDSLLDAHPLICRDAEGLLYSTIQAAGGGTASLWPVGARGEVTATMVYDALPVFDHFKKVDDHTLLGLMEGKLESAFGLTNPYYFWLERDQ